MAKVLIIGSTFFNFNDSVQRAFKSLGWETFVEGYDNPIHPFKGWMKWRHKFSFNRKKLKATQAEKYNRYIIEVFQKGRPDLVFILNGNILSTQTLDCFREKAKVVVWMYDAVERSPESRNHIDHSDLFFCYEKKDIENYQREGKTAYFLPQACDETLYYPTGTAKDIDILFVGVLYRYEKRIRLLKAVVERFPDKNILIIGTYKPWYKDPLKWLFREKRAVYTNRNVPVEKVNDYYNRARVVLNIHHETQQDGANPKVFEIAASGAYQICDTNPFIEALFPEGELSLYHNEKELLLSIEEALRSDLPENRQGAREIILKNHTFTNRIQEVLNLLKNQ